MRIFKRRGERRASLSLSLSPVSLTSLSLSLAKKPPSPVTKEAAARYEHSLRKAASQGPELAAAERSVAAASYAVSAEASWFWRFQGPEKRAAVAEAKAAERRARARLEKIYLRGDEMVREGKQALGLWSQAGVDESRRTFKRAFESGKVFARRQTLWDGIMRALFGESVSFFGERGEEETKGGGGRKKKKTGIFDGQNNQLL